MTIAAFVTFWRSLLFALRLLGAAHELPDVDHPPRITPFVLAALEEATPHAPAPLLVALGYLESRFDPTVRTGVVCGAMQVNPADIGEPRSACDVWSADVRAGIHAGVIEIETMLGDRRVHGDLRLMLLYRACGNVAFAGTCSGEKTRWVEGAISLYGRLSLWAARGNVAGT